MLPCRKRVCSKHVSVCVVVSPKANLEPPTKFQIIPWQALGCAAESDGELKATLEMITSAGRRDGDGTLAYKLMCNECGLQAAQYYCTSCSSEACIVALCGSRTGRNCMTAHGARGGPKAKWSSPRRRVGFSST